MEIQHFLHAHPLKLKEIIAIQGLVCTGCGGLLSGQNYVCRDWDSFSLHRSCSNLPRVIQHHLHPCLLNLALEDEFRCVACQQFCKGFAYRCEKCDFLIDPDCSQLPSTERPANGVKENSIQHFGHEHCLTLFRDVENDHKLTCKVCGRNFCSCCDIYGCWDGQLFLHKSCLTILPRKVHPFSHRCPLTLCTTSGNSCNGCGENSLSLIFRCSKCGFYLCVPCWLEPAMKPQYGDEVLTQHPLFLQCQSTLSCGKLLHQFNHFSHPSYPVSLMPVRQLGRPSMRCDLCRSYCGDDAFLCFKSECRLCLHVKCAFLTPTVIYEQHDHPLTVVDNICDDKLICQSCHVTCINSPAFCCQQPNCNYGLHILCGPLPRIIKHQCHVHPLLLEDYYLDEDGDDANNFCCHFCEERRDPVLCVYRCVEGCAMVCEAKCVISEVQKCH